MVTTEIKKDTRKYYYGLGRRKRAIARVRLYEKGKGNFTVNNGPAKDYFFTEEALLIAQAPLKETGNITKFDISVLVNGSGPRAQAEAVRHGIARALVAFDKTLRTSLKPKGYLKRDPRKKERKKPGLKKARRAPQFSKR